MRKLLPAVCCHPFFLTKNLQTSLVFCGGTCACLLEYMCYFCYRSVMEKSFLEYYDFYESVCKERLHLQGQTMQVIQLQF